jgi:hypothetical protein
MSEIPIVLTRLREAKKTLLEYQQACVETVAKTGDDGGWNRIIRNKQQRIKEIEIEARVTLKTLADELGVEVEQVRRKSCLNN